MVKTYVLDTNVCIHDPEAVSKFEDNVVVIPLTVIEELDKLKRGHNEIAYSAREALRTIHTFKESGDITKGVKTPGGGKLYITGREYFNQKHFTVKTPDNCIISTAIHIKSLKNTEKPVILISKDTAVRIKAICLGIESQDYCHDKTTLYEKYGYVIDESLKEDYPNHIKSVRYILSKDKMYIYKKVGDNIQKIKRRSGIYGINPKNVEQECLIDALLDDNINLVAVTGEAGTGKTLISLAAALHLYEQSTYRKSAGMRYYEQILVSRPIVPIGRDIGYLPGNMYEKIRPWMSPIYDNLDYLISSPEKKKDGVIVDYSNTDYLIENNVIRLEALTYIRGRSLPRRFFIVDEAQNLRPFDIKTIVTRCGEGTKLVLCGDIKQIDNPFLDAYSNGLSYLIERFINEEDFCYIHLKENARSTLARKGTELL